MNNEKITFSSISPVEAKKMMKTNENIIVLDVRTKDEYKEGHIEHAIHLPVADVETEAEYVLLDKEQTILVYCRSGLKCRIASAQLVDLGYTNVYEFGGLQNWDYETVK